ncbi:MAG: hypothetical protein ACI9DJ_002616 [Algoriphagus sp.]|jgi:hypothetical protein
MDASEKKLTAATERFVASLKGKTAAIELLIDKQMGLESTELPPLQAYVINID